MQVLPREMVRLSALKGSKKDLNVTIWYSPVQELDRQCCSHYCGMQAQIVVHGGMRELPLCNDHCAQVLATWKDVDMVEEERPAKFVDPATNKRRVIEGGLGLSDEERYG